MINFTNIFLFIDLCTIEQYRMVMQIFLFNNFYTFLFLQLFFTLKIEYVDACWYLRPLGMSLLKVYLKDVLVSKRMTTRVTHLLVVALFKSAKLHLAFGFMLISVYACVHFLHACSCIY